jgi:thiamine biosynthesis lipoprotein
MERRTFRAMGTDVEILLDARPDGDAELALARAEFEFARLEALLSRFRPESELSRLNEAGELAAGEELREVVALALDARARTGGRFDPTVHDAVVAAGYDRSFDDLADSGTTKAVPAGGGVRVEGTRIALDPGVRLDLGGIGKGYAVDRIATWLAPFGPCLVNAGGDLAVAGVPPEGSWPVGVDTPRGPLTLGVREGALATSGRDRRRWTRDGEEQHHLIDPVTGRPAATDLVTVTVAAPTAVEAEIAAKSLFLAGSQAAAAEADATGIPALLVTDDGAVRFAGGLR